MDKLVFLSSKAFLYALTPPVALPLCVICPFSLRSMWKWWDWNKWHGTLLLLLLLPLRSWTKKQQIGLGAFSRCVSHKRTFSRLRFRFDGSTFLYTQLYSHSQTPRARVSVCVCGSCSNCSLLVFNTHNIVLRITLISNLWVLVTVHYMIVINHW